MFCSAGHLKVSASINHSTQHAQHRNIDNWKSIIDMKTWPPPGESPGCPTEPLSVTCCPFLSRQCCCPVTLTQCVVNGPLQWEAGRHALQPKRHCKWRQCKLLSIVLASSTHSIYVHRTLPVESRSYCSPSLVNVTSHRACAEKSGNVTN